MRFVQRSKIHVMVLACILGLGSMPILTQTVSAKAPDEQLVCLDPGHQLYGNNAPEPVAPNSKEMKAKVTSGTRGVKTRKPEYVLTLEAALLLREKLEKLGYKVAMTRESHEADISNVERAQLCNAVEADLAVRIHADGSDSPKARGISLLYPAWSKETETIAAQSKEAAEILLREATAATGAVSRGAVPRSDLTGFNWSTVPSVLVEMGFMTNPDEDEKLSNPDYLDQLTEGLAAGINLALAIQANEPESEADANAEAQSRVYIQKLTPLYELSNGRMIRTKLALSPQVLQLTAIKGSWGKVNTWLGEQWIYLGASVLNPVKPVNLPVQLPEDTPIYRSPADTEPVGRLSAQKVIVTEQWEDWYRIETWMGGMWVSEGHTRSNSE